MVKSVLVRIILIPRIERIEGSGQTYPISFLRFSKMFLRISMNAIYNCNRLDLNSDYSFIANNLYISSLEQEINILIVYLYRYA